MIELMIYASKMKNAIEIHINKCNILSRDHLWLIIVCYLNTISSCYSQHYARNFVIIPYAVLKKSWASNIEPVIIACIPLPSSRNSFFDNATSNVNLVSEIFLIANNITCNTHINFDYSNVWNIRVIFGRSIEMHP